MTRVYLWGSGLVADDILTSLKKHYILFNNNSVFKIEGIIDNDISKYGTYFHGFEIVSPGEAINKGFDYVIILMGQEWLVEEQALFGYGIPKEKIKRKFFLLQLLLILKYQNSTVADIQATLQWWENNDISMFNQFLPNKRENYPVIWDKKINLPYIEFRDITDHIQRMYYPRDYRFKIENGIQVVPDVLWEQTHGSPHLYTFSNHEIEDGDVIVDGGVCEGNFALRYACISSKMYLFEPDRRWEEPHFYTFKSFQDKLCYFNKGLSNREGKSTVIIDNIFDVKDRLDFIKMDIEGAEICAIEGAKNTLKNNNVKCSICSYHKKEDERTIRELLEMYGYQTSTSNGSVVFLWDEDIWENIDFRKCVVYGYPK